MNYSSKKVLLTGATGLIGKEAIEPLIKNGFKIYAISSKKQPEQKGVTWFKANLFEADEIKNIFETIKPEYLLHFAWVASGDYLTSDINIKFKDASLNMLKEFHKNGGKRVVMAGTCFEYHFKDTPLKEDDKLNPQTLYAKCKNELREKAQIFCKENDISFAWGRIFYVYGHGENEKRLTAHVANLLKADKTVKITSGPLIKDYMYTKDIALAFVTLLKTNVSGCVNICTGKPISIKEYVSLIASILGKEKLLQFEDNIEGQPKFIVGDSSRLIDEVGYNIQYSLDKALDEIIKES
jgi:nucleoside-diphosphate-sugar epimerase